LVGVEVIPLVATGAIDDVGAQGNAGELLFVPIDARRAFVGLFVDAVQGGGVTRPMPWPDFATVAVGGVIDGYRRGVDHFVDAIFALVGRLKHVDGAHYVDTSP
jgi:hypothetical protein